MFLFEPARTQFDLNFRLFGIDVRVHPMFWLVTVVLGWDFQDPQGGMNYVVLWVVVVFISVLIHELGHIFMGRIFGSDGHIVLYGFGGLAIGSNDLRKRWQRIAVSFAGPFVLYNQLVWVNSFWALMNLLPIWPLDGGMISRELFQWTLPESGTAISLIVSLIVAGALAVYSLIGASGHPLIPLLPGDFYMALFFGLFAVNNFQEWQMVRRRSRNPWDNELDSW